MLNDFLKDHQLFNSEFQDDYFVTQKSGTDWGQYKQAIRELYKRVRGLRESYCDYEKLLVEIEEKKLMSQAEGFEAKYAEIEHRRKVMQIEEAERVIRDTEREFKRFYQQAYILKQRIGDVDRERRKKLDREQFEYKVKEMLVTDWMLDGKCSRETHELLHSLPIDVRKQIIEDSKDKETQFNMIEDYINKDNDYFKDCKELDIDIKCLLKEV